MLKCIFPLTTRVKCLFLCLLSGLCSIFFSPLLCEIGGFINLGLDMLPFTLPLRFMILINILQPIGGFIICFFVRNCHGSSYATVVKIFQNQSTRCGRPILTMIVTFMTFWLSQQFPNNLPWQSISHGSSNCRENDKLACHSHGD